MQKELLRKRLSGILPEIDIAGRSFIIDWRLRQLRAKDSESVIINLDKLPVSADGEYYVCVYHIPSSAVLSATMKDIPDDSVILEIPNELALDPVAVARQYGLEETALVKNFPIKENLSANIIAVKRSG